MTYIRFPIESNPSTLAQDVFDYITTQAPLWTPQEGNLDVWIIRAVSQLASENRDLASDVQDDIFRYFGATIMGIQPGSAVPARAFSTWTLIDSLGHTIPAGTNVIIRDSFGDPVGFTVESDVVVPNGNSATGAGAVTLVALEPGADANSLGGVGVPVELIDVIDWVQSAVLTGITSGGLDEEDDPTYLNRLVRRIRHLSLRPILPQDFADLVKEASDNVTRAVAIDGYNPQANLLTANQASMETDASGWAAESNTTITSDATQFSNGAKSVRLRSTAGGNMSAKTTPTSTVAVLPNQTVVGSIEFKSAVSARSCQVELEWLTSGDAVISQSTGTSITDSTSGWTRASAYGQAPATAAKVILRARVLATGGASEDHYIDKALLRIHSSDPTWTAGGTATATNQERMISVAAIKSDGLRVDEATKAVIDAFLQANREVNFVVHMIDAAYTTIDVTTTVVALSGYLAADVQASVVAAINNYLSSVNWGGEAGEIQPSGIPGTWIESSTLYYNEMITLISNVVGVARLTALTLNGGTSNVSLAAPASLTKAGTVTVTVT